MPRSKRFRPIITSTTSKKKNSKTKLLEHVRECAETSNYTYVFEIENFRNNLMGPLRKHWEGSTFLCGKNTIIQLALGKKENDEIRPEMSKLSPMITGGRGLFCTGVCAEEVLNFFESYERPEFARAGFVATEDFILQAGPLDQAQFPFSMKETLRILGLPVLLDRGVVVVETNHAVCLKGDVLTPEQAKLLKLWGKKMAIFRINIVAYWHNDQVTTCQKENATMVETEI